MDGMIKAVQVKEVREAYDPAVQELYENHISVAECNTVLDIWRSLETPMALHKFLEEFEVMDHWDVLDLVKADMGYVGYGQYWYYEEYFEYDYDAQLEVINDETSFEVYNIKDDFDIVRRC